MNIAENIDCMEGMRRYPDKYFDLAVVDPPYGGGSSQSVHVERERELQGGHADFERRRRSRFGGWFDKYDLGIQDRRRVGGEVPPTNTAADIRHWDIAPRKEYFDELARVSKQQIIWGGNYFGLPPTRCFLIWDKVNISENFTMSMCEYAWTSFNDNAKLFRCIPQDGKRFHPTQKPVALYKWIFEKYAKDVRGQTVDRPVMTVDASNRYGVVAPVLTEYYGNGQPLSLSDPLHTVTANDREALTAVHIDKYFAGGYEGCGNGADEPISTITALPRQSVVCSHLAHFKGQDKGQDCREPLMTVTQADGQFAEIRTVVVKWDGQTALGYWPQVRELLNRFTEWNLSEDEVLLLRIGDAWYYIRDIGLRMLTPRELYNAMGFPPDYIIDKDANGRSISRKDQVARCGNAVCPPLAAAVVRANCPELCPGEIQTMADLHRVMTA